MMDPDWQYRLQSLRRSLTEAVTLLTRIPIPSDECTLAERGQSVVAFPLVGILYGIACWFVCGYMQTQSQHWSAGLAAAVTLALWAWLSRGLHWDGAADVLDMLGSRAFDPVSRLALLKDVHAGTFAVLGLILMVLLQWQALAILLLRQEFGAIFAAAISSRWAMGALCSLGNAARPEGLGAVYLQYTGRRELMRVSLLWGILLLVCLAGYPLLVVEFILVSLLLTYGILFRSRRLLGGQTGDVAGFLQVIVETVLLVIAAIRLS